MSSRERVLAAIAREPVDHVPSSTVFKGLHPQQRVGHEWQFPWDVSTGIGQVYEYCIKHFDMDPIVRVPKPSYPKIRKAAYPKALLKASLS